MNLAALATIARRDLTVVARSRAVSLPLIVLPVVFFVVMPAAVALGAGALSGDLAELEELLAVMPASFRAEIAGLSPAGQVVVWVLEYVFATFFLIVPLMMSAVIGADSFAGEKERKTLEALVHTPTTDRELYLGKLLGPWIAAVAVGTVGFVLYAAVANLFGASIVGRPVALTGRWALVVVWLAPGVAALGVGALVVVSSRVRGFQEAYQLGGLVVLPLVLLLVGQLTGALYLDLPVIVVLGGAVWAAAAAVLHVGYGTFRRERLLLQA